MRKERKYEILKAVVELFISTANPVGSKFLKESSHIDLSPATLRNEMAELEEEGLLVQTHTSGGRIPTTEGYRFFVNDLHISDDIQKEVKKAFQIASDSYFQAKKADQTMYDVVSVLSQLTPNIAFATIPSAQKTFFLGLSHLLLQPEYSEKPSEISGMFRVLEEDLYYFLHSLDIQNPIEMFIGKENILHSMDSCSLLVSHVSLLDQNVFFGILGPMRMDYAKNIIALQESRNLCLSFL